MAVGFTPDSARRIGAAVRVVEKKSRNSPAASRRKWAGINGAKIYIVDSFADLPDEATVGDAALGYTEDKDYFYGVRDGAWRILHAFAQDVAPSSIGEENGDFWIETDDDVLYFRSGDEWIKVVFFYEGATKGDLPLVDDPALGYATGSNVGYWRSGSGSEDDWLAVTHSE